MIFWIAASVLTAAVLWALLRPLLKPDTQGGIQPVDVYKAQLAEIEREAADGIISEDDASTARTEIARRILRASEQEDAKAQNASDAPPSAAGRAFGLPLGLQLGLPLGLAGLVVGMTLGGYFWLGQPGLPGQPYGARDLGTESAIRLGPAAQELERQLAAIDDPAEQAVFLGDAFASLGGVDEAMEAYLRALSYRPDDADILARLGEAVMVREQGLVTPEALDWFDRALAETPGHLSANFYRALHDFQQGQYDAAETRLNALLAAAPEGASYVSQITSLLSEVQATEARNASVLALDEPDREALIREMVAGLAARLEETPDDFDGWLRLASAYGVLDERDAARAALAHAAALAEGTPVLEARVAELAETLD